MPDQPNSLPNIPAPQREVELRTMASDTESLAKTGGNQAIFQAVKLSSQVTPPPRKLRPVIVQIASVILLLGLVGFGIYYFLYHQSSRLIGTDTNGTQTPPPAPNTTPAGGGATARVEAPTAVAAFTHQTLFRKPVDQTIPFTYRTGAASAAELQTYSQQLERALAAVRPTAAFIEITLQDTANSPLSFGEYIYEVQVPLINQTLFAENFNPDFTFFMYRSGNMFFPGYVVKLQDGKNWLFVKDDVAELESRSGFEALFVGTPNAKPQGGFTDVTLTTTSGDRTARERLYTGTEARFLYGWFQDYLIFSTSEAGFREAVSRL